MSWSRTLRLSRTEPAPARTMSGTAVGSIVTPSRAQRREHVVAHGLRRDQPERVVMGPGPDGADDLVRLGGREDEAQVRRGLLDELEQGVEALLGDHVGLVDDVDLVAAADGREERAFAQVTGVVDASVAGRVDLDDVERAGPAGGQLDAGVALAAGLGRRALLAVEGAGHDPGAGGLAAAAWAREQVGVVHPVVRQGGRERRGDVVLPDHVGEPVWPVAPVEGERAVHVHDPISARRR